MDNLSQSTAITIVLLLASSIGEAQEVEKDKLPPPAPSAKPTADGLIRHLPDRQREYQWQASANRQYVVSWRNAKKTIELWDLSLDKPLAVYESDRRILHALVNNRGTFFMTCSTASGKEENDQTQVWDASRKKPIRTIEDRYFYSKGALNDTGTLWLKISGGNEIETSLILWDLLVSPPRVIGRVSDDDEAFIRATHFDGKSVRCLAVPHHHVSLWDVSGEKLVHKFSTSASVGGERSNPGNMLLDYNPELTKLLSWHVDKAGQSTLELRTHERAEPVKTFPALASPYPGRLRIKVSATFNSDATQFLTWDDLETVQLWSITGEKPLATFKPERYLVGATIGVDENRLLTWSTSKAVQLWDVKRREALRRFPHESPILGVVVHPDGDAFVTWQEDGTIRVYDFNHPKPQREFHWLGVTRASFDRTGQRLITTTGYQREIDNRKVNNGLQIWKISE